MVKSNLIVKNEAKKRAKSIFVDKMRIKYTEEILEKLITVKNEDVVIAALVTSKYIELTGLDGKSFVFVSHNSLKTLEKWEKVLNSMLALIQILKRQKGK